MSSLNEQFSQRIVAHSDSLANAIVTKHYLQQPELAPRYGEKGQAKCLSDAHRHLTYLAEAMAVDHPSLFANYIAWGKVLLSGLGIPEADLAKNLQVIGEVLKEEISEMPISLIDDYIQAGLQQLPTLPSELSTFIKTAEPHADLANQYFEALLSGKRQIASQLILNAVNNGISIKEIYLYVFQRTQYEIGRLWQMNKVSVAQEHYCTAATQLIMSQLYAYIFASEKRGHTLVATCVGSELHEMGVRMVADFFEMEGWDTFYLGANMPPSGIIKELEERKAEVLAISATMTFHISAVTNLITTIRSNENFKSVKIMVGGYPFNVEPSLWQKVGADAYAKNADEAIKVANSLLN